MKRLLFALAMLSASVGNLLAQSGELSGRVTDEKGEGVPFANVAAEKEGSLVTGATTDFDGYFTIKPLNAGKYDLKISYIGYATSITKGIVVSSDKITELDVSIKPQETMLGMIDIVEYKVPLIDKENNSTKNTITHDEISALPTKDINSIASTTAGVYQSDEGGELNIKGARTSGTEYYIDGIRVRGSTKIPSQAIEELTVITGGVPAKYGDATGGIITITTRGPSRSFDGGIELVTSQGMDRFGYNLGSFNLSGPIVKKNKGTENEKVLMGFFLSGEYLRHQDKDPSIVGVYKAKDDVLKDLEENPLVLSTVPGATAFVAATERVTKDDLEKIKIKENVAENNYSLSGKLDFRLSDNINLTLGGNVDYTRRHDWVSRYTMFNSENNPLYKENTWRVFARFTQKFKQKTETGEDNKESKSAFQNAYYTVQVDYSKEFNTHEDESHGFKPFHYGYLGKYDIYRTPIYGFGTDDTSGKEGWIQLGYQDTLVTFVPGDVNPTTTSFVKKYYELAGDNRETYYQSLDLIQLNNGMLNGDRVIIPHGIWYNTGRQFNGYAIGSTTLNDPGDNEQYRLSVSGSVDILRPGAAKRNKHSLEFGFEFEQRIDRRYSFSPIDIWSLMRQSANRHLVQLDRANPILLIDGVQYAYDDPNAPAFSVNDTILYNRLYLDTAQTFFDKSLREKLGLPVNGTDIINVDSYSPDFYSLDMFSADDLLDYFNASNALQYFGYDYLGNKLKEQPSFDDFFKEKDENGNYTRPIGAFRPIYTAAYIQDKFTFKDLLFNIGFRVDRFDANQKVLKDRYTLYQAYTVGEARTRLNQNMPIPANIGDDYVVYVDNFGKTNPGPLPVGYRDGDTWYNSDGVEVNNPQVIASASSTGSIQPYLVNGSDDIKSESYDPNTSFEDYTPQVTFMPRIAFSFELTDNADFFAHYDVLTQRPPKRLVSTPLDWYYFEENVGGLVNNPSLKPERTIDYQVGFRQLVARNAAITLSGFYRELKDNIQVVKVAFAYPRDYLTFGNQDFGTVKGFSLAFDLRKTKTSNISLKANYTLQFAEGTGSSSTSQFNLVNSGQPNLRTIVPFNYDSRHLINLSIDYSYGEGKDYNGPKIKGKDILSNMGINITARARAGEPYTQQANATPEAQFTRSERTILEGKINGSRLPWNYRVDLRLYKDFNLKFKKSEEGKSRRDVSLGIYLLIQNLLNTKNVVQVYPYTGEPDDDGYLASPTGQQELQSQTQSYEDLYNAWTEGAFNDASEDIYQSNFSLPRAIRVGLKLDF